jgi:VanZ family protein
VDERTQNERLSPWVIVGRVVFTLALAGCIWFIFSNSMAVAQVSSASSGRVLQLMQAALRRLGHPALAQRLTMHFVRKLAHFCEYMLEGFLLMLCMRVYSRHPLRHITVPMLGGVLTALTDETIQLYSPGRSSQVTDVWLDSVGVLAGILAALVLMALCRLLFHHRDKE